MTLTPKVHTTHTHTRSLPCSSTDPQESLRSKLKTLKDLDLCPVWALAGYTTLDRSTPLCLRFLIWEMRMTIPALPAYITKHMLSACVRNN